MKEENIRQLLLPTYLPKIRKHIDRIDKVDSENKDKIIVSFYVYRNMMIPHNQPTNS
jgi:hypothetical protein